MLPAVLALLLSTTTTPLTARAASAPDLEQSFQTPSAAARPWVYWYFMDGHMTSQGITADLESMKQAGIGGAIFLTVDIGIPRGPVAFMSPEWQALFKHAVAEADRLGIQIALGAGPGWCGTGGPWIKPEQSMQHLVASETNVSGPLHFQAGLPRPQPRVPFFGENTLTPVLKKEWRDYYRDVAVLAFPTTEGNSRLADVDEKALYFRPPFSSRDGVRPFFPTSSNYPALPADQCVAENKILDLIGKTTKCLRQSPNLARCIWRDMNHEPDPAAIFACAHSLWDACQKAIAADSKLNLGESYNGMDQFMRELMRVAAQFENWSCQHLDFSELDEGGMIIEPR